MASRHVTSFYVGNAFKQKTTCQENYYRLEGINKV